MSDKKVDCQYEILSPWADADPVMLKGLAPRLNTLEGKKIGMLANVKRAARPILAELEKQIKKQYPSVEISWYQGASISFSELDPANKPKFESWLDSVDAVILAAGD